LISENQGLEKLRSVSNPRKISGSANLDFCSGLAPGFFQIYSIKPAFFLGGHLEKKSILQNRKFF
jgi:hypothetical protein